MKEGSTTIQSYLPGLLWSFVDESELAQESHQTTILQLRGELAFKRVIIAGGARALRRRRMIRVKGHHLLLCIGQLLHGVTCNDPHHMVDRLQWARRAQSTFQ